MQTFILYYFECYCPSTIAAITETKKYENQFTLEKVNLEKLPDYIKNNVDNYKEWIDT